jgi:hypothetical protein
MIDRHLCLFDNLSRNLCFVAGDHASRVHDVEGPSVPLGYPVDTITSDSGFISNDRAASADKAIKEGRFADVGPTHNGDQAMC